MRTTTRLAVPLACLGFGAVLLGQQAQHGHGQPKPGAAAPHMEHRFDDPERYARSFDDPARDAWQLPARVIEALQLRPDETVADIGAGTGYFTVRLARSPAAPKIYAVDIEPAMVEYVRQRAAREGLTNVVAVQAGPAGPNLPEPVDVVLIVDTYHHLPDRVSYFTALKQSLKPGARLAIVDFRKGAPEGPPEQFRFTPEQITGELAAAGFSRLAEHDFLPRQIFLVYQAGSESAQAAAPAAEWRYYGGTAGSAKYSPLDQIGRANVARLQLAWRWSSPDNELTKANPDVRPGAFEDTPLMANGVLYTISGLGVFSALDAGSGRIRWQYDPETWKAGRPTNLGWLHRGLAYWTDGSAERILAGTHDAHLISIDAKTGKPDPAFGSGGRVDLAERIPFAQRLRNYTVTSAPVIVRNVVIVGASISDGAMTKEAPRGDVSGYDVRTGRQLWTFRSVPRAGEPGFDTWEDGSAEYTGNTNVWSLMSVDEELGYVYLPFGTPTNDYYGGHRPGDNLFAESLVCLDATTGKRVWHFQAVHHGLWDYDFPAAPTLVDITVDGRPIRAVAQVSKQGFVYVFDRATGAPVWPIEERPVPPSRVPGEKAAATQPFPTRPPAFERQGFTDADVVDFTPELKARAMEAIAPFERGPLFTPPSEKGTIQLPGNGGGANWSGAAFDPETGRLYVPSVTSPFLVQIVKPDPARSNLRYRRGALSVPTIDGLPIVKPPYSRLTAYDLPRGTIEWQVPIGDGPRDHPLLRDLKLGPLGGGRAYVLLTRSLLFVAMRGSQRGGDAVAPEPPALFALDKGSGEIIWKTPLPGGPSTPMTYLHEGRQYVVMAVGGGVSSELVAFALPAAAPSARR